MLNSKLPGSMTDTGEYKKPILIKRKEHTFNPNSVKFSDDKTDAEEYIIQTKVIVPKEHGTQTEYFTNESELSTREPIKLPEHTGKKYNKNESTNKTDYIRPTNQAAGRSFKAAVLTALPVINMNKMTINVRPGMRKECPKKFIPTMVTRRSAKKPQKKITYDDDNLKAQPPTRSDDSSDGESSTEDQNKERSSTLQVEPFIEVESGSFIQTDEHFGRQTEVSNRLTRDFETDYNVFYDDKVRLDLKLFLFVVT